MDQKTKQEMLQDESDEDQAHNPNQITHKAIAIATEDYFRKKMMKVNKQLTIS